MASDCTTTFLDRNFMARLDSNFSLIGCKNGVYDFNIKKFCRGRPSDYITMSTHRNFVDGGVSLEDIVPINTFLNDVLIEPEVIDWSLVHILPFPPPSCVLSHCSRCVSTVPRVSMESLDGFPFSRKIC